MAAIGTLGFVAQLQGPNRLYEITSSTVILHGFTSGANHTGLRIAAGTSNYQVSGTLTLKLFLGSMQTTTAASNGLCKLGWSTAAEGVDTTLSGSATWMCGDETLAMIGAGLNTLGLQAVPINFAIPNTRYPIIKGLGSVQQHCILIGDLA